MSDMSEMSGMAATATATSGMDHASMTMSMAGATSAAAMDHGMGGGCKISVRLPKPCSSCERYESTPEENIS